MSNLMGGSADNDYLVTFPQTWRTESKTWAVRVGLPQAEIDDIEQRLMVFRRKRDNHRVGVFDIVQPEELQVA